MAQGQTIRKDKEFALVLRQGRIAGSPNLRVRALPGVSAGSRYGLVISTKVSKKAVERNQIRRRLRAMIVPLLPRLTVVSDLVFLVSPAARALDSASLKTEVEGALKKLGLI